MKLSQTICISLTLLICFSPTLSLAMEMEMSSANVDQAMDYHLLDINEDAYRDTLVERLQAKNIQPFKSIYNRGLKEKFKIFIRESRFCLKSQYWRVLPWCILVLAILVSIILLIIFGDKNLVIFWSFLFAFLVFPFILCILCYCADLSRYLKEALEDNDFGSLINIIKHKKFVNSNSDLFLKKAIILNLPEKIIELLFDKGGRFAIEDFGKVIEMSSFAMVKLLVDLGIDVNVKDENGTPAIITAVLNKKLDVIKLLSLQEKFNCVTQDANGKTVFDYLEEWVQVEYSQEMKNAFNSFRQRISDQICTDLAEYQSEGFAQGFPKVQANLIAEYLV